MPMPKPSTSSCARSRKRSSSDGLGRVAWGEVAELRWQLATFGFHLASLEVRQHSAVHRAALATIRDRGDPSVEVAPGVTTAEVLATFRSIGEGQHRYGPESVRRVIVSFTAEARDVTDVLALAAAAEATTDIDVVPLFESSDALLSAGPHPRCGAERPRHTALTSRGAAIGRR